MGRAMCALQMPEMRDLPPTLIWVGAILIGFAVLMTLLDWGDISGVESVPPPRRRPALVLSVVGLVMVLVGLALLLLLD